MLGKVEPIPTVVHVDYEADAVFRQMRKIVFEKSKVLRLHVEFVQHLGRKDHVVRRIGLQERKFLSGKRPLLEMHLDLGARPGHVVRAQSLAGLCIGGRSKNLLEELKRIIVGVETVEYHLFHGEAFEHREQKAERGAAHSAADVEELQFAVGRDAGAERLPEEFDGNLVGFEKTSRKVGAEVVAQIVFEIVDRAFHPLAVGRINAAELADERNEEIFEVIRSG